MLMQFQYPDIRELEIQKIQVIHEKKEVDERFVFHLEEGIWYAEADLPVSEYRYCFLLNETIYINDPYTHEYRMCEEEVWSIAAVNQQSAAINQPANQQQVHTSHQQDITVMVLPVQNKQLIKENLHRQ